MKIKKGFVLRDIAGQAVATATGEASESFRGMIKLNSTARDVWVWLDEGKSPEEISVLLSDKYNVPRESTFADVTEMIEKMEKAGFLEL
ncbi:MAG: PqqD family protein [Ruminococcaceae bacterium]|nr:PqqD family protein [Oscillospiraceae bacterium]